MNKMEMNGQKTMEMLFEKQEITCTKTEYHRDVRTAIETYHRRAVDLGKTDLAEFCQSQIDRLDKEHGLPPN